MLVSEAYEKVVSELSDQVSKEISSRISNREGEAPKDALVGHLGDVGDAVFSRHTFGGTVKELVNLRAKKKATEMVNTVEDWSNVSDAFESLTDDLFSKFKDDLLRYFAMGYSFADPANSKVPRDKDGFIKLSRELDRTVLEALMYGFSADQALLDKINERLQDAGVFMTSVFSATNVPPTKFSVRDWIERVFAILSLDTFVGGGRVRELLEEEASFESMMKEMDE